MKDAKGRSGGMERSGEMDEMSGGTEASGDHPEDFLDLASTGAISEAQWQELRPHLALCFPCATQLRMGIRDSAEEKVTSSDVYRDRLAAYEAVERFRSSRSAPRRFAQRWISVGIGVLLASSAALAATWWSVGRRSEPSLTVAPPARVPARAATGARIRLGSSQNDDALPNLEPERLAVAPPTLQGTPTLGTRSRLERSSASELFARARALRLGGNPEGALSIYRRLQRDYADSREARLSYLVVGRMWLERDRPDVAAAQFSRYLDNGGSASEEALVGRATAFGRMGRADDEGVDWRALLAVNPRSVYANRARTRLHELADAGGALGSQAGHP
jgi:hypothetical protein